MFQPYFSLYSAMSSMFFQHEEGRHPFEDDYFALSPPCVRTTTQVSMIVNLQRGLYFSNTPSIDQKIPLRPQCLINVSFTDSCSSSYRSAVGHLYRYKSSRENDLLSQNRGPSESSTSNVSATERFQGFVLLVSSSGNSAKFPKASNSGRAAGLHIFHWMVDVKITKLTPRCRSFMEL